jgi:hypothetical protein
MPISTYSKANRDLSAMAAGSHSDHAPVSVELGRICGRDGTDDCEDGRQSEGAPTIANHRSPRTVSVYTHTLRGKALSNRHSLAARAMRGPAERYQYPYLFPDVPEAE